MEFLEKLWALDESTKTKILVGATAIVMVIVVSLWYLYFNSIVIGASGQAAGAPPPSVVSAPTGPQLSVGQVIWRDISSIFSGMANSLSNFVRTPGQYTIKPNHG
jgi:hypothetical protein